MIRPGHFVYDKRNPPPAAIDREVHLLRFWDAIRSPPRIFMPPVYMQ